MAFFWICSNANVCTSPTGVVLLLLGLSQYFAFGNTWVIYSGVLTLGYLLLCGLPININYGLTSYDTYFISGIARSLGNNTVSWDFIFWANYLFSFQIYILLVVSLGLYLYYSLYITYSQIIRSQNFFYGTGNAAGGYLAYLTNVTYFSCSMRANIALFITPICILFFCYTSADAGMRDVASYALVTAYSSAYRSYTQNTGTGVCLISDNLLLQSYYVIPHTLFILLLFFFNTFIVMLFRYFAFINCAGFFQEVTSRLSNYFLPITITSLFFGGLWSMHNDFFFLFWSWDYIELFFLDFVLLLSVFGHIFTYTGPFSVSLIIIPVLLLKFFRLSLLESVHHLSLFNNNVFLTYGGWAELFSDETLPYNAINFGGTSVFGGFSVVTCLITPLALLAYAGLRCTYSLCSLATAGSLPQLGSLIKVFKLQVSYSTTYSLCIVLGYCYYSGLFFVFTLLVLGGGFMLTSLSAACSVFLLGEDLYYLVLVVWLLGFFFWIRYFFISLISVWQHLVTAGKLYALYVVAACAATVVASLQACFTSGLPGILCNPDLCRVNACFVYLCTVISGDYFCSWFLSTYCGAKLFIVYAILGICAYCLLYVVKRCVISATGVLCLQPQQSCEIPCLPRYILTKHALIRAIKFLMQIYPQTPSQRARPAAYHHLQFSMCFLFLIFCFFYQTFNFSQACVANSAANCGNSFFFLVGAFSTPVLNSLPQLYNSYSGMAYLLTTSNYWHIPNAYALPVFHNSKFFNLFFVCHGALDLYASGIATLELRNINFLYGDICVNRIYFTQSASLSISGSFNLYGNLSLMGCCWGILWYYETFFTAAPAIGLLNYNVALLFKRLHLYFRF